MKKNLVIAILFFLCVFLGYQLNNSNQKVVGYAEFTKEQKSMMEAYKQRLQLADTAIVVFDTELAEKLREQSMSAAEAADMLDLMAETWKETK